MRGMGELLNIGHPRNPEVVQSLEGHIILFPEHVDHSEVMLLMGYPSDSLFPFTHTELNKTVYLLSSSRAAFRWKTLGEEEVHATIHVRGLLPLSVISLG
uniref:Uncharacterized protein n=1 Tax=Sphaerodactylus townsendi TaxID=933632 RepID=A0ACB8EA70_9SAUR